MTKNETRRSILQYRRYSMAINPQMYETQYGFEPLDMVHNFFPEMMYDTALFPNQNMAWMRHRVSTLFPDVYVRQQNMYRLYQAEDRRIRMEEWRRSQIPPSPIAQESPMNNTFATPPRRANPWADVSAQVREPPSTPVNQISGRPMTVPGAPSRPAPRVGIASEFVPASSLNMAGATNIITNMLRQPQNRFLSDDQMLLNMFTALGTEFVYEDVIVRPTLAQINAGSQLVNDAPEGTNCAICQEHGEQHQWRRLYCTHYFHNTCIATGDERRVECPVCRADIRVNPNAPVGPWPTTTRTAAATAAPVATIPTPSSVTTTTTTAAAPGNEPSTN